jgi:hypothetical protein
MMKFLASIFLLIALAVLALQGLYYLKEGGLLPLSLIDGLNILNISWADDPTILLGLHQTLKTVPLSLVLLLLAAVCYFGKKYFTKK